MDRVVCPTASALLALASTLVEQPELAYLCTWSAFESITNLIARQSGIKPQFRLRKNGTLRMVDVGNTRMPSVSAPERPLVLQTALSQLDAQFEHAFIIHKSVETFAFRTPTFGERLVKVDSRGQRLNGVIDLRRTMDARYPIWSPITLAWYQPYRQGQIGDETTRHALVMQIVDVMATIKENLLWTTTENLQECSPNLVACAQALLVMLVNHLTRDGAL